MTQLVTAEPTAPEEQPETAKPPRGQFGVVNVFSQGFLLLWAAMVVLPLLWAVMSSFKTDKEILSSPWSLPASPQWDNFARAWSSGHIGTFFLNTVIVLAGGVTITMVVGAMAAYVLARYSFPGNRIIYYGFVAGLTLPIFLALVPLFKIVGNLGNLPVVGPYLGLNSYLGLILVYVAFSLPFTVFFLHSFFRTLPTEIAEAGLLDGAGHATLFARVMLPMARPGLISIGIFNVIGQWNQYLLPLVLLQPQSSFDTDHSVLAEGLLNLAVTQGYKSDWSGLFAGMTIAMLPMLAVYVLFQRQVQAGLTAGTLK
ncbi:carbohydrate ABC transporter permease [Kutzneria buriramensis]|uniref:N-acetylglucosamine transport system permease protein n=1 Tax=Kutzneria buriramensis TaxID=1045776 RepID=A0A3E0HB93_9PSEU|nr:carbohydrate ABC transporter permease [Kutzneria buriramensis]REH41141.1 N-acetylglucosamine transport system permease protein [Kutzneria buriramensis]